MQSPLYLPGTSPHPAPCRPVEQWYKVRAVPHQSPTFSISIKNLVGLTNGAPQFVSPHSLFPFLLLLLYASPHLSSLSYPCALFEPLRGTICMCVRKWVGREVWMTGRWNCIRCNGTKTIPASCRPCKPSFGLVSPSKDVGARVGYNLSLAFLRPDRPPFDRQVLEESRVHHRQNPNRLMNPSFSPALGRPSCASASSSYWSLPWGLPYYQCLLPIMIMQMVSHKRFGHQCQMIGSGRMQACQLMYNQSVLSSIGNLLAVVGDHCGGLQLHGSNLQDFLLLFFAFDADRLVLSSTTICNVPNHGRSREDQKISRLAAYRPLQTASPERKSRGPSVDALNSRLREKDPPNPQRRGRRCGRIFLVMCKGNRALAAYLERQRV